MASIKHFYTYETHTKLRWRNRPLIDVLCEEFTTRTREYYEKAINCGVITIGNKRVNPSYKLKDMDIIYHSVHFHEPIPKKIDIIKDEGDYVVVNKPAGIPAHPTGGYVFYSVTKALFPNEKVGCVNRLDLPVSGVLIIVRKNHEKVHDMLENASKYYVAKVKGFFPDEEIVDKPIGATNGRMYDINDKGKASKTLFKRLNYQNGHSIVQCQPITGRTHQIRIHLKYLGFPIVNDMLYGDGKDPLSDDSYESCDEDISEYDDQIKYKCIVDHCKGENNRSFHFKNSFICLHAWKYEFNGNVYEAEWPIWTNLE